jgi:hypothetical protein
LLLDKGSFGLLELETFQSIGPSQGNDHMKLTIFYPMFLGLLIGFCGQVNAKAFQITTVDLAHMMIKDRF